MKLLGMMVGAVALGSSANAATAPCHLGAFRLTDGRTMVIGPSSVEGTLRYRLIDGTTGRLYPQPDGTYAGGPGWASPPPPTFAKLDGACGSDALSLTLSGRSQAVRRVRFTITETTFKSGGLTLRGRLVAPPGAAPTPLVVLVHGSEDTSAVDGDLDQYMAPANGIATFVYDKRGTGASEGKYTQNFDLLSGDAVNAMSEARRLFGKRTKRAGFAGFSQGGWISPLAATKTDVDFILVGYGLAISPRKEDGAQVQYDLERAGYGPDVLAKAREVTDATSEIMASRFTRGFDKLDAVKAKYKGEPWLEKAQGEYTGIMLHNSNDVIKDIGMKRDVGTSWDYDPLPALHSFTKPMLWVLAGADADAPSPPTEAILATLQRDHPKLDVAVYPNTTHEFIRFSEDEDGKRTNVGYAATYQPLMFNWLKTGQLTPAPDVELRPGSAARSAGRAPKSR